MSVTAIVEAAGGARLRRSPYQGLVPYSEEDAEWFFGRDEWREIVVDNLRAYRLSVLYGASGVGKSSLLYAGVVRRLREEARRNLAEGGLPELIVTFADWSTADPTEGVMNAICGSLEQFVPRLAAEPPRGSLMDILVGWGERLEGMLLVVLDQFEEYFLYHAGEEGPGSFHEQLSLALRRRDTPANFLLAIREDALARLDRFEGQVPGLLDNLLRLEHLDREAAREAITRPLEQWNRLEATPGEGVEIEPALVEAVLAEVAAGRVVVGAVGGRGSDAPVSKDRIEAPYLQLVLSRLWAEEQRAGSRLLRLATLRRLGGAERIVRTHLDATMDTLPRRERAVAARAFRYLVTPSGTKIAHRAQDLAEYAGVSSDRLEPVLARLAGGARILRPVGNDAYEIYHDALAEPILDWQTRRQGRRRYRRIGLIAIAFALAAAVLAGVAVWALHQQDIARRQRDAARSRALAALANVQLDSDPQQSLRLAVQSAERAPTGEAEAALRAALAEANLHGVLRGHDGPVFSAAFSPNGRLIVTASDDNTARVWEARSGRSVAVLRHTASVLHAAFSPDGRRVVTASEDGTARVWDAASRRTVAVLRGHHGAAFSAAFSPDGRFVVTASRDGTARVWEARSGRRVAVLHGHYGAVFSAVFSPDGELVVTADEDGTARVWEPGSGRTVAVLRGHDGPVNDAAFSPDGQLVVTAGEDGTARVWEAATGQSVAVLRGHTGSVRSAAFSPDGELVVTAGEDGTARVWEAASGQSVGVLRGHARSLNSASFSPDGMLVVTASFDGTARVWEAGQRLSGLRGHDGPVLSAAFSPDGRRVVTAGEDGTARIWDAGSGKSLAVLRGHQGPVVGAAFSPDGMRVVTASGDGTARIWDAKSGRSLAVLRHTAPVLHAAFSPEGRLVLTASRDRTARIWDARSGRSLAVLRGHHGAVFSAPFSPDGRLVVTASGDATARVWDAGSGKGLVVLRGHKGPVFGAAFSPDGSRVVTASLDHTARIWDTASARSLAVLRGHDSRVVSAAFSSDGGRVVTASGDQTARIWDAATGKGLFVLRGHDARVFSAAFSPDGRLVLTASRDGTARIWEAASGKSLIILRGYTGPVFGAVFSPNRRRVVTATRDETAWIYHCRVCGSLNQLLARAREQLTRG